MTSWRRDGRPDRNAPTLIEGRATMPSTNGHGPKRAILYARVSTDEQVNSGYSLAQQIEALRAHAAREGLGILEEVKRTPDRAGRALSDRVWTACGIW